MLFRLAAMDEIRKTIYEIYRNDLDECLTFFELLFEFAQSNLWVA